MADEMEGMLAAAVKGCGNGHLIGASMHWVVFSETVESEEEETVRR
jgi:hypothetical protein